MKVGIVGSRRRNTEADSYIVTDTFLKLISEVKVELIISGGCKKGGDKFAEEISALCGIPIKIYYPEWNKFGRLAGFMRNTDIAKDSDILIACVHRSRTGGTEDTVKKFIKFHPRGRLILVGDKI